MNNPKPNMENNGNINVGKNKNVIQEPPKPVKVNNPVVNNRGAQNPFTNRFEKMNKMIENMGDENSQRAISILSKGLIYLMTYISLVITTNYMSNVYINDTLIEKKNPPSLVNYGLMYIFINIILNSISYFIIIFMVNTLNLNMKTSDILVDIMMYIIISGLIIVILAYTMGSKKYFLYEDDGLRSNRAIKDIMLLICLLLVFIPYNKLLK